MATSTISMMMMHAREGGCLIPGPRSFRSPSLLPCPSIPSLALLHPSSSTISLMSSSSRSSKQYNRVGENPNKRFCFIVRSQSNESQEVDDKVPFGYTRKDVLLIGVGVTILGFLLKYGLEAVGVDSMKAGNAVQLVLVLGLCLGWVSTYVFRVSNKEMTYAKQLQDYEEKVMQKRLEEIPEAELEVLLAQVEEEKRRLQEVRRNKESL